MVKKFSLLAVIALFAAAAFLLGFDYNSSEAEPQTSVKPVKAEVQQQDKLVVYYFYGKPRCVSCKKIESYTDAAVSENFVDAPVEYVKVDLDKPENKHYLKDYGLYTKSVVLSKIQSGEEVEYKNLDQIWAKLKDENAFKQYIVDEINKFKGK